MTDNAPASIEMVEGLDGGYDAWIVRRVAGPRRDDYAIVRISPSLDASALEGCGIGDHIAALSRHMGESIFPMPQDPIYVNIYCLVNGNALNGERLDASELRHVGVARLSSRPTALK